MMGDFNYDIDSNSSNTVDVLGLNDINIDFNLGLPQPFRTESTNSLEVKPLAADLDSDTHLAIDPLRLELEVEPLNTNSNLSIDLKPAVIDLCLTTNVGKLPNVCIRQPYQHHIGFTLFGVEVWGYTFAGQQETIIEDIERHPAVVRGSATHNNWPPRQASQHQPPAPTRDVGGVRVRLGS
jgi:hypothetical protein